MSATFSNATLGRPDFDRKAILEWEKDMYKKLSILVIHTCLGQRFGLKSRGPVFNSKVDFESMFLHTHTLLWEYKENHFLDFVLGF